MRYSLNADRVTSEIRGMWMNYPRRFRIRPTVAPSTLRRKVATSIGLLILVLLSILAIDAWVVFERRAARNGREMALQESRLMVSTVFAMIEREAKLATRWLSAIDHNALDSTELIEPGILIHASEGGSILRVVASGKIAQYGPDSLFLHRLIVIGQGWIGAEEVADLTGTILVGNRPWLVNLHPAHDSQCCGFLLWLRPLPVPAGLSMMATEFRAAADTLPYFKIVTGNKESPGIAVRLDGLGGGTPVEWVIRPRDDRFNEGLPLAFWVVVGLALFGFAFNFLLLNRLDILIIRRLERLRKDLMKIRGDYSGTVRVTEMGEDDLGKVALQVNLTLDALQDSRQILSDAQKIARLGSLWLDLEAGIVKLSSAYRDIAGLEAKGELASVLGLEEYLVRHVHSDDRERVRQWAMHARDHHNHLQIEQELEFRAIAENGEVRYLRGMSRRLSGDDQLLHLVAQDITKHRHLEEELLRGALYDPLTGLPNRTLFHDRLLSALSRRETGVVSVALLELDRFVEMKNGLGSDVTDGMLLGVAVRLLGSLPPGATVARMGMDQFGILLDSDSFEMAGTEAESIRHSLSQAQRLGERDVTFSVSIGLAGAPQGELDPEELLRRAESALFQARYQGGDRLAFFDEERSQNARHRINLELELRGAISRGQMEVWYQPILKLSDLSLAGFEALVRWRHPERGLVSPVQFIPLAEETGIINELGQWVLETSLHKLAWWDRQGAVIDLSVNLSAKQMAQESLITQVKAALAASKAPVARLKLEITESALTDDPTRAADRLVALRELGIRTSLDDFGTGYSSLGYLHRFPVDTLKVDKSFVDLLRVDRSKVPITRAIVSLAHNLGMDVVAEGIEQADQLIQLKTMGCEYGQGFLFSRPLPEAEADQWVLHPPQLQFPVM